MFGWRVGHTVHMKNYRLLVINPGSTSTKISVFDNEKNIFTESVFHDAPLLLSFGSVSDQAPMRKEVIFNLLKKHNIDIHSIDVFIGRGGCAYSQPSGVMTIDQKLYEESSRRQLINSVTVLSHHRTYRLQYTAVPKSHAYEHLVVGI